MLYMNIITIESLFMLNFFTMPFKVYPTTTRALGLGACSGMSRIGALVTPFVAQVSEFIIQFYTKFQLNYCVRLD